jgi:hypothetical protein
MLARMIQDDEHLADEEDGREAEPQRGEEKAPQPTGDGAQQGLGWRPRAMPKQERLLHRAIRGGWVDDAKGLELVDEMMAHVRTAPAVRDRIGAARVLATIVGCDVARERNQTSEHKADLSATLAAIRLAQSTPEGRAALAALSQEVCSPALPADPPTPPAPPADNVR